MVNNDLLAVFLTAYISLFNDNVIRFSLFNITKRIYLYEVFSREGSVIKIAPEMKFIMRHNQCTAKQLPS